jgi:cytochrome c553
MAFNPTTGLVYIPAQEIGMGYATIKDFKPAVLGWNLGVATTNTEGVKGYLVAWDPVVGKERWRVAHAGPWNGGVLTTGGDLVVQGNATGALVAYRADTGAALWSASTDTPVMAAPMTYEVDGEQYVAVLAGWGGAYPLLEGRQSNQSGNIRNVSRLLVYGLHGQMALPRLATELPALVPLLQDTASPATLAAGEQAYDQFCSVCHGESAVGGGVIPDLRKSPYLPVEAWYGITLQGSLSFNGMANFSAVLDRTQSTAIRAYVIHRATADAATPTADQAAAIAGGTPPIRAADTGRGAMIAARGNAEGAPGCALCHAFNGVSDGSGAFPRIAGQSAYYLGIQLDAFRSGVRQNAIMSPIARRLSPEDIADVSAYYAALSAPFLPLPPSEDEALVLRGERLASVGKPALGMPGCVVCHGVDGAGQPPTIPYLGGQYAHYLAFELQMWTSGFRRNSSDAMALIAPRLDAGDIAAVAAYYERLGTPGFAPGAK